jgi:hypothetical protein
MQDKYYFYDLETLISEETSARSQHRLRILQHFNGNVQTLEQLTPSANSNVIGDRIEREFKAKDGKLTDYQSLLFVDYFRMDCQKSYFAALSYLELAANQPEGSKKRFEHLVKSAIFVRRALRDVKRAKTIAPESKTLIDSLGIDHGIVIKSLVALRNEILASMRNIEYSSPLIKLHLDYKRALAGEEYERLDRLQVSIRSYGRPQLDFSGMHSVPHKA